MADERDTIALRAKLRDDLGLGLDIPDSTIDRMINDMYERGVDPWAPTGGGAPEKSFLSTAADWVEKVYRDYKYPPSVNPALEHPGIAAERERKAAEERRRLSKEPLPINPGYGRGPGDAIIPHIEDPGGTGYRRRP